MCQTCTGRNRKLITSEKSGSDLRQIARKTPIFNGSYHVFFT